MGKLSKLASPTRTIVATSPATSPIKTKAKVDEYRYSRKAKGELFLLAVANMVGEDTFYEGASERDQRFRDLIHKVTVKDPDWIARFVPYLRNTMNMRSASIVMAAESAMARLDNSLGSEFAGTISIRALVSSALQRADEPGEFIAYWRHRGRGHMPGGVQRGVADAITRLFNEYGALKYDGVGSKWRLGDAIELARPTAKAPWQDELFKYLLDRRHHKDDIRADLSKLPMVTARAALAEVPSDQRRVYLYEHPTAVKDAGFTWEDLSGYLNDGQGMTKGAWESVIPQMGYMALLRNLRNFEQAGISKASVATVVQRLTDPEQVAKSRQFPMRFLSAYKAVNGTQYVHALEEALDLSLANVPVLKGSTLILVDLSGSMYNVRLSAKSDLQRWEAAAVFGTALAVRAEQPTLVAFGTASREVQVPKGAAVLPMVEKFGSSMGGTATASAIRRHYTGQDRVIILTDEGANAGGGVPAAAGSEPFMFTFNLAGYRFGHAPSGTDKWHTFGGLTDAGFRMVPLLEAGVSEVWPF